VKDEIERARESAYRAFTFSETAFNWSEGTPADGIIPDWWHAGQSTSILLWRLEQQSSCGFLAQDIYAVFGIPRSRMKRVCLC
jgi:hypothetical protein